MSLINYLMNSTDIIINAYNRRTVNDRVRLEDIHDFMKLLETSLFIQYHDHYEDHSEQGGWLALFFENREARIIADSPYYTNPRFDT